MKSRWTRARGPRCAGCIATAWRPATAPCCWKPRELKLPEGEGYVWVAAESATAKALREIMVGQHGVDKRRIRAASYWKRGVAAVHESHDD